MSWPLPPCCATTTLCSLAAAAVLALGQLWVRGQQVLCKPHIQDAGARCNNACEDVNTGWACAQGMDSMQHAETELELDK